MSSYARTLKKELYGIFDEEEKRLRAELIAILRVGGIANNGRIDFTTSNVDIARI